MPWEGGSVHGLSLEQPPGLPMGVGGPGEEEWLGPSSLFFLGMWEEDGKGLRREGAEFSMSSCQNVISCVALAGSLGRIN